MLVSVGHFYFTLIIVTGNANPRNSSILLHYVLRVVSRKEGMIFTMWRITLIIKNKTDNNYSFITSLSPIGTIIANRFYSNCLRYNSSAYHGNDHLINLGDNMEKKVDIIKAFIKKHIFLSITTFVVIASILIYDLPIRFLDCFDILSTKEILNAVKDTRQIAIQIITGFATLILATIAIRLTERRTKALEDQNKINGDNNNKNLLLQQYSKAAELLNDDKIAARLSGIYLFEKVMKDKDYHWQIIELLTAYVREKRDNKLFDVDLVKDKNKLNIEIEEGTSLETYEVNVFESDDKGEATIKNKKYYRVPIEKDIQAIITVLGRREREFEKNNQRLILNNISIYNADISNAHFENAYCFHTHFEYVNSSQTHFEYAKCYNTHFENSICWNAHFEYTECIYTHFEKADFRNAHFENSICLNTHFDNAKNLTAEQLSKAKTLLGSTGLSDEMMKEIEEIKKKQQDNKSKNKDDQENNKKS